MLYNVYNYINILTEDTITGVKKHMSGFRSSMGSRGGEVGVVRKVQQEVFLRWRNCSVSSLAHIHFVIIVSEMYVYGAGAVRVEAGRGFQRPWIWSYGVPNVGAVD